MLQKSYTGEVLLFSEKPPQAVAVVTVGSLTSSPVYLDSQREGEDTPTSLTLCCGPHDV